MIKKILETIVIATVSDIVVSNAINGAKWIIAECRKDKIEIDAEQDINEIGSVETYKEELRWAVQA